MNKVGRLFIVPMNDAESLEIIRMLLTQDEEVYKVSKGWGVSWDDVFEEYPELERDPRLKIGVELGGKRPPTGINIDHHRYQVDDRYNEYCSLEQIASYLNIGLTEHQKLLCANDKGYIPGMISYLKDFPYTEKQKTELIAGIRMLDRAAQGITELHEKEAERGLQEARNKYKKGWLEVNLSHSKTACVCDRVFGEFKDILVLTENATGLTELNVFSSEEVIEELKKEIGEYKDVDLFSGASYIGATGAVKSLEQIVKVIRSFTTVRVK